MQSQGGALLRLSRRPRLSSRPRGAEHSRKVEFPLDGGTDSRPGRMHRLWSRQTGLQIRAWPCQAAFCALKTIKILAASVWASCRFQPSETAPGRQCPALCLLHAAPWPAGVTVPPCSGAFGPGRCLPCPGLFPAHTCSCAFLLGVTLTSLHPLKL